MVPQTITITDAETALLLEMIDLFEEMKMGKLTEDDKRLIDVLREKLGKSIFD